MFKLEVSTVSRWKQRDPWSWAAAEGTTCASGGPSDPGEAARQVALRGQCHYLAHVAMPLTSATTLPAAAMPLAGATTIAMPLAWDQVLQECC